MNKTKTNAGKYSFKPEKSVESRAKLRAALLMLAAIALIFAAGLGCGRANKLNKDEPAATETPEATQQPEMPEQTEGLNLPTGTTNPVEVSYSIPEGKELRYKVVTIVFPTETYRNAEGARLPDAEPFEIGFLLPLDWKLDESGSAAKGSFMDILGDDSPLYSPVCIIDEEERVVGVIGYATYPTRLDPETQYKYIYSRIASGSYRFLIEESYHPFRNGEASNITAITQTVYTAEGVAPRYNPAIVALDPERGVYIAMEFVSSRLSSLRFLDIAESLRIY